MSVPSGTSMQKFFVVLLFLTYLISILLFYFNTANFDRVFYASYLRTSYKYFQQVTPVGVVISIVLSIVYIWNFGAVLYILISLGLSKYKSPVNVEPTLVSNSFLVSYIVMTVCTIGWLFAFDQELLGLSLTILVIATAASYVAIGISYKKVYDNAIYLNSKQTRNMLWLTRILIQNGLALFCAWLTLSTCLNLADVIIYHGSFGINPARLRDTLNVEDGSSIVFAFILALIILWFTLDHVVFENYTRYTFTVFLLFIMVSAGQVAKLQTPGTYRNYVFAAVTLGFSVFAFVFRVVFFLWRLRQRQRSR